MESDLPTKRNRVAVLRRPVLRSINQRPDDEVTLYFVQCETTKLIKIGLTTGLRTRLSTMRGCCPTVLTLLAHFEGTRSQEAELHRRFAAHRAHREWFYPDQEILSYIEQLSLKVA